MILNKDIAKQTIEYLLQIKAIKIDITNPFAWASGWKSPIYCDNRKTLSYPKIRTFIRQQFAKIITEEMVAVDLIAGVATGGIANGALVAQELGLPFIYVRNTGKEHGLLNQIEGVFDKGQNVVVVEDLVSTGNSSIKVVKALREAGCKVTNMAAIFTYGFDVAVDNLEKENCKLFTLTDYQTLIEQAVEMGYISEAELKSFESWRENPEKWNIGR